MRFVLAAIGWMGLALPVLAAAQDMKGPEYDVVSVRPTKNWDGNMMLNGKADGYSAQGTTVTFLVMDAYHLKNMELISGMPKWAGDTHYDVETKMDPEMIEKFKTMTEKDKDAQRRLMLQAVLADRFKLKVHEEEKEVPAYALVIAKGGLKMKPTDTSDPEKAGAKLPNGERGGMLMYLRDKITGQMVDLDALAQNMGMNLNRQVIDRTGVKGTFDFTLRYTPDDSTAAPAADAPPNLFTALEEQLGLKLESIKAKITSVVVDHIEQPEANQ